MLNVMSVAHEPGGMVKYQFEIDDDKWVRWKNTVPRSKSLEERIIELIEADTEGRVREGQEPNAEATQTAASEATTEEGDVDEAGGNEDVFSALSFPGGVDHEEGVEAILAARDFLREQGPASMKEIVTSVGPDHPLKYDPPEEIDTGERFRGAWWRKVVKPGLEALGDVEAPNTDEGETDWVYVGGGR